MPFVLLAIIIIWIIVANVKKKNRKNRDRIFKETIKEFIDECAPEKGKYNEAFQVIYEKSIDLMISNDEITREALLLLDSDTLFNQIPQLKTDYVKIANALSTLANKNTVLISDEDELSELEKELNELDWFEQKKRRSNDIIRTIPCLADLVEVYSQIYKIYNAYNPFTTVLQHLLFGLKDEDCESNDFKASLQLCTIGFHTMAIVCGWEIIKTKYPKYNSSDDERYFAKMVEELKNDYIAEWVPVWYNRMLLIVDNNNVYKFAKASIDLYQFVRKTNEELGDPDWLPHPSSPIHWCIGRNLFNSLSGLDSTDCTKKGLMRIYSLYTTGQMDGKYTQINDPKYANLAD